MHLVVSIRLWMKNLIALSSIISVSPLTFAGNAPCRPLSPPISEKDILEERALFRKHQERLIHLNHAIQSESFAQIKKLISDNPTLIYQPDEYGQTPLHHAARKGLIKTTEFLIQNGAQIDRPNVRGATALYLASSVGQRDIVSLLLEAKADIHTETLEGRTPLAAAAFYGWLGTAEFLLKKGAILETTDKHGRTPLWGAVKMKRPQVVSLFLKYDPDLSRTFDGKSYLDIALENKDGESAIILMNGGAKTHSVNLSENLIIFPKVIRTYLLLQQTTSVEDLRNIQSKYMSDSDLTPLSDTAKAILRDSYREALSRVRE